jgi:branched-chain amino acid transport system ATP-binding protein
MLMEVKELTVGYGARDVVHAVSMKIDKGEIVALIGHNGGGKTTCLKGIFGLLKLSGGDVLYEGRRITGRSPRANVADGITFIPQERFIFPRLSVRENLDLGAYTQKSKKDVHTGLGMIYDLFPILKQREWQTAATLSGGERRMLGLGMALLTGPQLLFLDEPSLGLAPVLVHSVFATLQQIQQTWGITILLVEQNVKQALEIAQRAYVMKMGRITMEDTAQDLLKRGEWWDLF